MSAERQFSFVIFGATGFTGKYLVEYVAKIQDELNDLKWAVAGRSAAKLKEVLKSVSDIVKKDITHIPVIEADVSSLKSLEDMAAKTQLVINCVGPYEFFGEVVVKACIKEGAHHIDISGEPKFLEQMQLKYHEEAKKAKVFILGAAGFDSIPCETGIQFIQEHFKGDLNSVETFLKIRSGPKGSVGNFGTFQSAIHGLSAEKELKKIRTELFKQPVPRSDHKLASRGVLFNDEDVKKWCVPFPVTDKSVVARTNYYNFHENKARPFQFLSYLMRPSFFHAVGVLVFAVIFGTLASFGLGRRLLETFPEILSFGVFSKKGPSREQVDGTSFEMYLVGKGYSTKLSEPTDKHSGVPDQKIVVRVKGPEPGYIATPICMVQVALTVLEERSLMPKEAGVLTPGAALVKTSLMSRLRKHGITYEVLSNTL